MKRLAMMMLALVFSLMAGWSRADEVILGAGDVVRINVYGSPDLTTETRVSDVGNITFPLVGVVKVGGLTVSRAEAAVASLLESGGFVRKPQVNMLVTVTQSQQISVLGQVNRPGRYPMEGKRSVMDVLALAGGMNADGADTVSVIRKRNGVTTKEVLDVILMVRNGDFGKDYELTGNDVVFVERAPRFYIYGEVQRPGTFRLERNMTVMQALSVGGGLTPRGTERGLRVKRRDEAGKLQILEAKQDDLLQPDDVIYVKESLF